MGQVFTKVNFGLLFHLNVMKTKIFLSLMLILMSFTASFAQQTTLKVGDKATDFTLTNQDGKEVKLSAVAKKSNVVLVFYRGWW
jgi:cytochrome oxidase Cu insertion factor (SCO1/SenC/PrrC family)